MLEKGKRNGGGGGGVEEELDELVGSSGAFQSGDIAADMANELEELIAAEQAEKAAKAAPLLLATEAGSYTDGGNVERSAAEGAGSASAGSSAPGFSRSRTRTKDSTDTKEKTKTSSASAAETAITRRIDAIFKRKGEKFTLQEIRDALGKPAKNSRVYQEMVTHLKSSGRYNFDKAIQKNTIFVTRAY